MVCATKDGIHLLKTDVLCLCNEEPNVRKQHHIDGTEHIHGVETLIGQEYRECLLQTNVGDILELRRYGNGLVANIHREDLSSPDPYRCAPGWLEEECEQEHQEHRNDADAARFSCAETPGSFCNNSCCRDHACCHADGTNEEQEATAESVNRPGRVECENDAEGAVECIDELDGVVVSEHRLIDLCRIVVERALARELLANVKQDTEH